MPPPLDAKTQFLQACVVKTAGRANAACGAGETRKVELQYNHYLEVQRSCAP